MSYKRADSNSFAEYQMRQGFGSAVTGNINSTEEVAKLAEKGMTQLPAGLQGLNGYEGYPSHLAEYPEFGGEFGDTDTQVISSIAKRNMHSKPAGLQGYETFEGVEDDAFAGYGDSFIMSEEPDEDDEDDIFDGYGGLAGAPEQSFHTFFHQASMARSDTGIISALAKAVNTVSADTPELIRKQYYDLAKEMLVRRKQTNLHHLDLQRAEIESNIGWLVNPGLPKTGGFNAVLQKAIGTVGSKLASGEKDTIKAQQNLALGRRLQKDLRKENMLSGLGNFEGSKVTYVGLGLAGILAVGVAYYLWKNKDAAVSLKKKKRSRRKRK